MKRFLLLWSFILSVFCFGQYPEIHPLDNENGFVFEDLKLDYYTSPFTPNSNCSFYPYNFYKYFSYEATLDMTFAFDLLANTSDFQFALWKLPIGVENTSVFDGTTTIIADRSVQSDDLIKGMRESSSDFCESYAGDGYVKAFMGDEMLKKGETIVIAVFGSNITDTFTIKIHAAEEKTIDFGPKCEGQSFAISDVLADIQSDSGGLTDIKIYSDLSFSTEYTAPTVKETTTLYAQVRDGSGDLKYIYHLNFTITPAYIFTDKLKPNPILTNCSTTFNFDKNLFLGAMLTVTNFDDFDVVEAEYDDGSGFTDFDFSTNYAIPNPSTVRLKLKYKGTVDYCEATSGWINIDLQNSIPAFDTSAIFTADLCEGGILSLIDLEKLLNVDTNNYKLIVTGYTPGQPIVFGANPTFTFQVQLENIGNASCKSTIEDFTVNKTTPINIIDYTIPIVCLNELIQTDIDTAITTILNGTSATLSFEEDGQTISETELLNHIINKKSGTITVTGKLSGHCDTPVELTYNLGESTYVIPLSIQAYESNCLAANQDFVFTEAELKAHLSTVLGNNLTIEILDPIVTVPSNSSATFRFKVMKNGENCWSDEMQVEVVAINEPNINVSNIPNQIGNCDDELFIDAAWLTANFGSTIHNYDVLIDGIIFTADRLIDLDFSNSNQTTINIEIQNRSNSSCKIVGTITVNRATQFVDDIGPTQIYLDQNKITFCDGDQPITEIQTLLDYILTQHPTVIFDKTANQIVNEMTQNSGQVTIKISRVGECGEKSLQISYTKVDLPTIDLPDFPKVCAGENFEFDISSFDQSFTYYIINENGTRLDPVDSIFELAAASYTLFAENSSGCTSNPYMFTIDTFPSPIIKSISIENGTLVVVAEGSGGKLEYSLDNENWQTSNTFQNIDKGINYTVWVRENGCGGVSVNNIYVLNLPNFISPNGDGYNDTWQPIGIFENDKTIRFHVFDRYGNTVLLKEGIENVLFWDGKRNGYALPSGDYWYIIDYPKSEQNSIEINIKYSGNITIKNK